MSLAIRWEYKIEMTSKDYTPNLDVLGGEGWELVTVVPIDTEKGFTNYKYFFKRIPRR